MATEDVIKFLYEKEYQDVKPLGKGSYSVVLSAISPAKDSVAVKIVQYEDSWHIEELTWPLLNHKNVLPLNEMIDIEYLNVKLFVMPRMPFVLVQVLASDSFIEDQNGLRRVKRWLSDTLDGLEYLHASGFAHLDLKMNNVLISADDHALLCDFGGLDFIGIPLQTLCVPLEYSPPESYNALLCTEMEGRQTDVWLFGLMTLNILTKSWPSRRMGVATDAESWKANVETVLLQALEESTFLKIMKESFPCVCIWEEELLSAHDFVISMMQWEPEKRSPVQQIRGHSFLTITEGDETICEERSKPQESENFVANPLIEGEINSETSEVKISFRNIKTESDEQDIHQSGKSDEESVETNPLQDGLIDSEANSKNIPNPGTKLENTEKRILSNKFRRLLFKSDDAFRVAARDAPKQRKKYLRRIKLWFRNKWNQFFKKINKYELLTNEYGSQDLLLVEFKKQL